MNKVHMKISLFLLLSISFFLSGCSTPAGKASVSDDYIQVLADQKLMAINEADYETFLGEFSEPMKAAFPEAEFNKLRNLLLEASGKYESITRSTITNAGSSGFVAYVYTCKYEKENVVVRFVYKVGGDHVDGLFFDSTNLRKAASN